MLSLTSEYALRAVLFLAMNPGSAVTGRRIAEETGSPQRYMSRVLRDLVNAGLLRAFRGPSGGFLLARDAREITILDVVNTVDPVRRTRVCPLKIPSHGSSLCRLHGRLDEAVASLERVLAESRVSDLLDASDAGTVAFMPRCGGSGQSERLTNPTRNGA